jgi:glutathione S-transferase
MFFAAGPLEAAATNRALGFEVPAERQAMVGYGSLADVMSALEAALSRSAYLVGDRFTAADLYIGSHLGWGMSFGTLDKRPAFERYVERLSARPAAVRARAIDDALVVDERQPPSG